ncbi:membrane protein insertion efficiency factor YidD [Ochrobactrum sp. CM-21-5]|nr:membrane protein insertion efficiency factor YidD [Ochrobactrum sp. CM-21-5]MBC2886640.1 membrane protein insertion efficiency factor YidD [Ochrobactrum sp. CM-21-5]
MCACGENHIGESAAKAKHQTRNFTDPWRKTPARLFGTSLIRFYQVTLSSFIGNSCRHLPTCSEYAYEAIARHGLWNGSWMGLFRVVRCGPFGTHGFDPVPRELSRYFRWYLPWRYWRCSTPQN